MMLIPNLSHLCLKGAMLLREKDKFLYNKYQIFTNLVYHSILLKYLAGISLLFGMLERKRNSNLIKVDKEDYGIVLF